MKNICVFIISTSLTLHAEYALEAIKLNKHFFIKATVIAERLKEVKQALKGSSLCTILHN